MTGRTETVELIDAEVSGDRRHGHRAGPRRLGPRSTDQPDRPGDLGVGQAPRHGEALLMLGSGPALT